MNNGNAVIHLLKLKQNGKIRYLKYGVKSGALIIMIDIIKKNKFPYFVKFVINAYGINKMP